MSGFIVLRAGMADSNVAPAATALETKIKRGRSAPEPPPLVSNRAFGYPLFPHGPAMDALKNIASEPP